MFTSAATPVLVKKSFLSQLVHFHHRSWWYILQPTNKWMGEQTAQYLTCTYFHYGRTRVQKVKIWNVTVSRAAGYNQTTHQPAALHPQLCCAGLKPVRLVCCSLYLMLWTQLWCTHCSAHLVLCVSVIHFALVQYFTATVLMINDGGSQVIAYLGQNCLILQCWWNWSFTDTFKFLLTWTWRSC